MGYDEDNWREPESKTCCAKLIKSITKERDTFKKALKAAATDNARLNGTTCLVQDEYPCPYGDDSCNRDGEKMAEECNYRYYIDEYGTSAAKDTKEV